MQVNNNNNATTTAATTGGVNLFGITTKHGELRVQNSFGVWRRRYVLIESSNLKIYSKYGASAIAAAAAGAMTTTAGATTPPLGNSPSSKPTKTSTPSERKCIKLLDRYQVSNVEKYSIRVFPASSLDVFMFSIIDPEPTAASGKGDETHVNPANVIYLASENLEEAKSWKLAIEQSIKESHTRLSGLIAHSLSLPSSSSTGSPEKQKKKENEDDLLLHSNDDEEDDDNNLESNDRTYERRGSVGEGAPQSIRQTLGLASKANWRTLFVTNGLRIMCETALAEKFPCLLVGCVIPAPPRRVFDLIHNPESRKLWDGLVDTVTIIQQQDKHSRVEYSTYFPRWISSFTYASPREALELTYWTREEDGSYAILSQSVDGPEYKIPSSNASYVRMNIFASGFTITPLRSQNKSNLRNGKTKSQVDSCYLQYCCHGDPGGILGKLPRSIGISEQFLLGMMLRVIGIRECIEAEKYGEFALPALANQAADTNESNEAKNKIETKKEVSISTSNLDSSNKNESSSSKPMSEIDFDLEYGSFNRETWRPSVDPYQVRGKTYADDGIKISSGDYMFDLFAVDLFEVKEPLDHVALRPNSVAQNFLKKQNENPNDAKFLFIVHFKVPGSTLYAFTCYFSSKPGVLSEESEFAHLFQDFVDADDEFRDSRFKIIPRVVKGSYIVKRGVGTTPAILGKKIKQYHYR